MSQPKSDKIYWGAHLGELESIKNDKWFLDIWWKTENIPGSFTRLNASKYYEYCKKVPDGGAIVEVGVDQGRSATILMSIAERKNIRIFLVDSWESVLVENYTKCQNYVNEFRCMIKPALMRLTSEEAAKMIQVPLDLVHIDANHYGGFPASDGQAWIPKLKSGGIICFHDYAATFDAVTEAVDMLTETYGLEDLGSWDSLAIRRKP